MIRVTNKIDSVAAIRNVYDFCHTTQRDYMDPFQVLKTNQIAESLESKSLYVVYVGKEIRVVFVLFTYKTLYKILSMTGDTKVSNPAGCKTIKKIIMSGLTTENQMYEVFKYMGLHNRKIVAIECAVTNRIVREALRNFGYHRESSKVTAFSEILGIYTYKGHPKSYYTNYTGLLDETDLKSEKIAEESNIIRVKPIQSDYKALKNRIIDNLDILGFEQHNSNYNENKSWSALSLRSYGGSVGFIHKPSCMSGKWKKENPETLDYKLKNTRLMKKFPEVQDILDKIPGDKERVRFMKLTPNSGTLGRHTDKKDKTLGTKVGQVCRLHVPLITNRGVIFKSWRLNGTAIKKHMSTGYLWYLEIIKPHMAINRGKEDRIHLVIDVVANEELINMIYKGKWT